MAASTPRPDGLERPHPSRLAPTHPRYAEILEGHRSAVEVGVSAYRDPATGYAVFTAAHLLARGRCCGSGCRHCPWVGGIDDAERGVPSSDHDEHTEC